MNEDVQYKEGSSSNEAKDTAQRYFSLNESSLVLLKATYHLTISMRG